MPYCEYCGEEIGYLPFKCKYCGGTFCKKHRLPENHECTFELKHTPITPSISRDSRPLYQDLTTKKPSSRAYDYKRQKEIKKYLKQQKRQRRQSERVFQSGFTGARENKGTTFILIMIIICSITAFIFSWFGLFHLIGLSVYGLSHLYLWTLLTAPFISSSIWNIFGIFFLFILIYIFFLLAGNFELRFGTKFLIGLYMFCAAFTGLFYVIIRLLLVPFYPIELQYTIPIGLASGAIIGLISFIIYPEPNRQMMFLCCFLPVRMKGRTMIVILILLSVFSALFYGLFFHPLFFPVYLSDLGGMFASYLVYRFKFKSQAH